MLLSLSLPDKLYANKQADPKTMSETPGSALLRVMMPRLV